MDPFLNLCRGAMICLVPAFLPLIFVMHQEPAAVLPLALIVFSKS